MLHHIHPIMVFVCTRHLTLLASELGICSNFKEKFRRNATNHFITCLLFRSPVRGVALPKPASEALDMADHAIAVLEPRQPAERTVTEHPEGIHREELVSQIALMLVEARREKCLHLFLVIGCLCPKAGANLLD